MRVVKLYKKPKLRDPYLVAAWPGFGNVAIGVAAYLKEKLGAQLLGEIKPHGFFFPPGVLIKDAVIEAAELPQSKFYFWENEAADNDLIIFLGEAQPADKGYEFASKVLDVAKQFAVKRVYTCAAHLASIHHTREPSVWGVANDPQLVKYLRSFNVGLMKGGTISGMNGLLLGVAQERKLKGICLLGEIPPYTVNMSNPKACRAILEVLTKMLRVQIDMAEIAFLAQRAEEEMEKEVGKLGERANVDEKAKATYDLINYLKLAPASAAESETKRIKDEAEALFRIEQLFEEAKKDRSRAYELKGELDRLGLFKQYEDRFLDLFKEGHQ